MKKQLGLPISFKFLIIFAVLFFIGITPLTGFSAQFQPGHMFIWDSSWHNADILEYDQAGTFVRSFKSTLPSGYTMSGEGHMRWGSDGHLYTYAELNRGSGWVQGVFEWNGDGSLIDFHARSTFEGKGFEVANSGNFYVVDSGSVLNEWDRAFSSATSFTIDSDHKPDEAAVLYGNQLFVSGNHHIATFDVNTHAQTGWIGTSTDNNNINVSKDGILAVNQQWHSETVNDFVELYNLLGNFVGTAEMPELDYTTRGMAFDDDGWLYVVGTYQDGEDTKSQVVVFDSDYNFDHVFRPAEFIGKEAVNIAIAPVPISGAVWLLGSGVLGMLAVRRRKNNS